MEHLQSEHGLSLNEQQKRAVQAVEGAVLLLAVPGSGKTTVLIARLYNMIHNHNIPPRSILTMTFSRRAASDMRSRYIMTFGEADTPLFSTIHQFCYRVVRHISEQFRRPLPQMVEDISEIVRGIYNHIYNGSFLEREKLDELVRTIGYAKNRMLDAKQAEELYIEGCDFAQIYDAYQKYMRQNHYMDYDDMLLFTYEMFVRNPKFLALYQRKYRYICVDEAQDTSEVQHRIIALLAEKSGNLFMVGDEDQSIYGFRGAFPRALLDFEKEHPGALVLRMETNYRCTAPIVEAANRLIRYNTQRLPKKMEAINVDGVPVKVHTVRFADEQYQQAAEFARSDSPEKSAALLYRNNDSAVPLADILERGGIPFSLKDARGAFFDAPHIRDYTAFLQLALDPGDLESFARIYSKTNAYYSREMLRYVREHHRPGKSVWETLSRCPGAPSGKTAVLSAQLEAMCKKTPVEALSILTGILRPDYLKNDSAMNRMRLLQSLACREKTIHGLLDRLAYLRGFMREVPPFGKGQITLSTIHSSKGLEYDNVILLDLIEGQFPSQTSLDALSDGKRDDYEEEIRLCYVGATRARSRLILMAFSNESPVRASRFIGMLTRPAASAPPPKKADAEIKVPPGCVRVTDAAQIQAGQRVIHSTFGEGRVLRIEGGCMVWFNGVATKRLLTSVCVEQGYLFLHEGKRAEI